MADRSSAPPVVDAEAFKALGDPARLRVVTFLLDQGGVCCAVPGRICACDVEAMLGLSQPAVSHHMRVLAQAGLVRAERVGRNVFYTLMPGRFAALAAMLGAVADAAPAAHRNAA